MKLETKRNILAQTASYYDVFGILSGLLVRPKILLQKLLQLNMDWDTPLNPEGELYTIFRNIEKDLQELSSIQNASEDDGNYQKSLFMVLATLQKMPWVLEYG